MEDFGTPVSVYLSYTLERIQKRNPQFSLRALANKCGVSVGTLSKVMNAKMKLSPYHAHLILASIDVPKPEAEAFMNRVFYEYDSDFRLSDDVNEGGFSNQSFFQNVEEIKNLKATTRIHKSYVYQLKNKLTQRTLIQLWDVKRNSLSENFYDLFVDADREVAATAYFFKNLEGTYKTLICTEMNRFGSSISEKNKNLKVEFSSEGFPSIHHLYIDLDKHEGHSVGNIVYSQSQCVYDVFSFDRQNQKQGQQSLLYYRV